MISVYTWALALALVQPPPNATPASPSNLPGATSTETAKPADNPGTDTNSKRPDPANTGPNGRPANSPGPANSPDPNGSPTPADPSGQHTSHGLADPNGANPGGASGPNSPGSTALGPRALAAGPDQPAQPSGVDPGPDPSAPIPQPEPAVDGPIAVVTEITPDPSNIGDVLTLTVTAAYPAGYSVNLPTGIDFGNLHRVDVEESEPESTGTGFRKQFKIKLQHFQVGEAQVPAFALTYLDDKGEVHTVRVPPTSFTVDSLLANENEPARQLEDPPISLEYPNDRWELIIYTALAALLVGFLGMMLWGRFRRRTKPVVLPPPIPAHEVALSALQELEQRSLVEDGKFQLYYLELTEITKGYIEGRFGIEALDRTTEEIRQVLLREQKRIEPLNAQDVVRFLQDCDLVKFARFAPPVDEASSALGAVREMVERSLPAQAPAEPEKSADTNNSDADDPSKPEKTKQATQPSSSTDSPSKAPSKSEAADSQPQTSASKAPSEPSPESKEGSA